MPFWKKKEKPLYRYADILAEYIEKAEAYLRQAMRNFPTRYLMPHEKGWHNRIAQQRLYGESKLEIWLDDIKAKYRLNEKEFKKLFKRLRKDSIGKLMRVWGTHIK